MSEEEVLNEESLEETDDVEEVGEELQDEDEGEGPAGDAEEVTEETEKE